jgi:hypothetical protein
MMDKAMAKIRSVDTSARDARMKHHSGQMLNLSPRRWEKNQPISRKKDAAKR